MNGKKALCLLLAGFLSLSLLSGCGSPQQSENAKEKVTIALWSDQLTEGYGQYLQKTFPEVEFEFYVATNSTDFYRFKEKNKDLPDILTVRRFSLNDVALWKDSLMDLSGSELANTFHQSYLRSYTYSDGAVNWLPACAEVDGILINKTLLAEQNIGIPTNYEEFVDACFVLRERGIQPFLSNFSADYTCMEILQGLSASRFASQEGREWRQTYESGQTEGLSKAVWIPVFERMLQFIDYANITPSALEGSTADIFDAYKNHEVAMIRGTCGEAKWYGVEKESVLMPYYGETEEDNWYLTYPAFQVAANAKAEESKVRKELIFDIMEAMLNQEGLEHIASGQNMIPYNKDVSLPLSPMLSPIQPYLDNNRLYIRLSSSDMFSVSKQVVGGMIEGEYEDAQTAFDAFNKGMKPDSQEDLPAVHIAEGYPYAFQPKGGSPAASAVMNSLREELNTQLLIGQSVNVSGNITPGDYTEEELRFLTMGESIDILLCDMTGDALYEYLNAALNTPDRRGSVINDSTLYVSSGFEMELQRTDGGYSVEKLTVNGEELERKDTYSVAVLGNEFIMHKELLKSAGITSYHKAENTYKQIITERLKKGVPLAAPTDYIILHETPT